MSWSLIIIPEMPTILPSSLSPCALWALGHMLCQSGFFPVTSANATDRPQYVWPMSVELRMCRCPGHPVVLVKDGVAIGQLHSVDFFNELGQGVIAYIRTPVHACAATRNPVAPACRAKPSYFRVENGCAVINNGALRTAPAAFRAFLCQLLWRLDWKWVEGTNHTGFMTQVHYGYGETYGSNPRKDRCDLELDEDGVLHFDVKGSQRRGSRALRKVEIPMSSDDYIMVL